MRYLFLAIATLCGVAMAQEGAQTLNAQQQLLTPEQQAEIATAEANVVATPGQWLRGPEATYPEQERALGHHGRVEVRGLLGVDGRLRYATISKSSRAPGLDQSALTAAVAGEYRPAQDANGQPISSMMTTSESFYSFTSSEGVGAAMYTCPQFVLDMDWWKSAWVDEGLRHHYLYLLVRGLGTIGGLGSGGALTIESNESYATRWDRAIEYCRRHPDRRFADAMRPEGEYIDRMAARHGQRRR